MVVLAAVLGDVTGFLSGRRLGSRLRQGRLGRRIGEARWDRVAGLLERRGPWAIVLGRWVGLLRALTPTMAGASGLPMRRFLPASMVGASSWAVTVLLLGYFAGASLTGVQSVLGLLTGAALVIGAVALISGWMRSRDGRRAPAAPETPAPALVRVGSHAEP